MERAIYDVSQVNAYIKQVLDRDGFLGNICIRGELSNYKIYPSGHHYFTLKDAGGAMRGVMFKGSAIHLRFRPEDGMKVLASGRITVYERDGAYQLYCTELIPEGLGDLHVAFEQLKLKLHKEGLFDPKHKKPLPKYPHTVAIITSGAGAAVRDMLRILGKRYPLSKVVILPVRVQGAEAPAEICGAIRYANLHKVADVIITGRGGGSIEDLWAFNEECVARAIYESQIPIVTAVGHEPDVTISDFVADVRAATPSNGAEIVAPDQMELRQHLRHMVSRLQNAMTQKISYQRKELDALRSKRVLQSPENYLADRRQQLDYATKQLSAASLRYLDIRKQKFISLTAGLDAMSPLKVLGRGYSVTRNISGEILRSIASVQPDEPIFVTVEDGTVHARVITTESGVIK